MKKIIGKIQHVIGSNKLGQKVSELIKNPPTFKTKNKRAK
jgi:hypothetical protein